jgi:uncharacterized protein (DUF1015 family)
MIISSQRHINYDIVDQKIAEIGDATSITLPIIDIGNGYSILVDGHHRLAAAEELEIEVNFEERDSAGYIYSTFEETLEAHFVDSDWYDIATGKLAF